MECCTLGSLEHDVHPGAQLICMSVLVYDIEPCSEVYRQRLEYFPLVLEIKPVIGAGLALVANDRERDIRCLTSCGINWENLVVRFDPCGFHRKKKPAPQNIAIIDRPARIKLNSVGKDASVDSSCQSGEDQITCIVRCKQCRAVTAKRRHLKADIFEGLLICENCKVILLVLNLVQVLRIIIVRTGSGKIIERRLTWIVRDLEIRVGTAQQQGNPTR